MHAVVLLAVLRLTLRLELGPEYDSNANRAEVVSDAVNPDPPTGSALLRTTARFGLVWRKGINLLTVQASLGAKVFFNPAVLDQSVVVTQAGFDDRVRLGARADLGVSGNYYDAFQDLVAPACEDCQRRRDFRTGTLGLRINAYDGPGTFWLGAGYRGFQYKPDESFNFSAPAGDAGASVAIPLDREGAHELTVLASYHVERRAYAGMNQIRGDAPGCTHEPVLGGDCLLAGDEARLDWFHEAGAEIGYVGPLLASLGYFGQLDRSTSFGQSLFRHVLTLKLGYRLPWQLYATVKAQLMITKYLDPVLLDRKVSTLTLQGFEDENRNAVIVDLERTFGRTGLALDARYSFFTNELGSPPTSFRRHVGYLGLTYRFSTR